MARTYEIACIDCHETLWVGQGRERFNLYSTGPHVERLGRFLFKHQGHRLVFADDEFLPGHLERDEEPADFEAEVAQARD